MITSNSIQCSLCQMLVHYDCTNLTMNQLVNLDNGATYKCKNFGDVFQSHNSNNEFNSPYCNIDTNIEVNKWHCECSKLIVNIYKNIYENDLYFNNIDPDNNFLHNVSIECDYYTYHQFLQTFNIHQGLSIVQFNHRSLFSNLEEIRVYLNELRPTFDVITLSETWINTKQKLDLGQQPGYQLCHKDHNTKKGGGVAIYIRNCINFRILNNLSHAVNNVL